MRAARLVLLVLGLSFLGYMVIDAGPLTLLASIQSLSWRLLVVIAFPFALVTALDTLGWRYAFRRDLASFPALVSARLAGEAFNVTTPTATVGGEPVKAYLLRPRVPLDEGFASVIVAKTSIALAQGAFLVAGIAVALFALPAHSTLLKGMIWLLAVETILLGGFVVAQRWGLFSGGLRLLRWFGLSWGERKEEALRRLDHVLSVFYREHRRRLGLSLLFHFCGWVVGSLEVYLIMSFLGIPVSLATAFVIEAFGAAIKFAAFLIPAGLGAIEGGNVAIFLAFGLGAGVGLTFSLIRRVREIAWVAIGLMALAALRAARPESLPA
jgi:putative membrane protein